MSRMFYGYLGWMCYDCRTLYNGFWDAVKNQFTNKCCREKNKEEGTVTIHTS